jgi:hypothetical protein
MARRWPALEYGEWKATLDTLHAHSQVLGKIAVTLAPPEPQLQHAALRLTARGWETLPLPAPDGSGALVVALDLHAHQAIVEHSEGAMRNIPLTPHRAVGDVTRDVLDALLSLAGGVEIDPTPAEVPWSVPLDADHEHATYEPDQVNTYFRAATQAALVLAAFRAPYRGRSTPVNAWWGSFDLAVSLFSGRSAESPSDDNDVGTQEFAVGWWPGDSKYPKAAFYAYARPVPEDYAGASLSPPGARWDEGMGEYLLDWDDIRSSADPQTLALDFARSAFAHVCSVSGWDPLLAGSEEGTPSVG